MEKLLQLEAQIDELKSRIVISGDQVRIMEGLSDIDDNLGCITAGEFRAGIGTPGHGYTGTRMAYPPMRYDTKFWHLAGVDNDEIQWGANSTSGKIMAGAGAVTLDAMGIRVKTEGVENYHRRPMAVWTPGDSLELALRIRNPDPDGYCPRLGNLTYRAPGTTSTYPFWTLDFQVIHNDTVAGTDALLWRTVVGGQPTSTSSPLFDVRHYVGQGAATDNRTDYMMTTYTTDNPVRLYMLTAAQEFEIVDADTVGASAEGWIEVEIGNVVSYIRTYATK